MTTSPTPPTPALATRTLPMETPAFAQLATTLLRGGHALRFRAAGRSMQPTIRDGDMLTAIPVAARACRRGDVLLCLASGGGVVAHRLLRRRRSRGEVRLLGLRGDAACGAIDWIPPESVLGRIAHGERGNARRRLDGLFPRLIGLCCATRQSLRRWVRGVQAD